MPGIVRDEGHSLQVSVLAIGLFNGGAIAGTLGIGFLIDRFDPFKIMPAALLGAALALASLDLARAYPPAFMTAALFSGLFAAGAGAAMGALTISLYPSALRITGAGWVMGVGRLGAAIGPLGVGAALAAGLAGPRLFDLAAIAALLAGAMLATLGLLRRGAHAAAPTS
jgi:AAHS family 4-hydroxybenzoate transporter-like MFS transporter